MPILLRIAGKTLLVTALVASLFAPKALTQSKAVTIDELTRQSEVIAVGQVKELSSEWDETGTQIRTRVLLHVDEFVKGTSAGNTLTLYVPGGEVGSVGEIYSHMPVFKHDEQVMVFASQDKMQRYRVSAGQQGKFTIVKDQATGNAIIPGRATVEEFTNEVKKTVKSLE